MAKSKKAVDDGKLVRQFTQFKKLRKKYRLTSDEVVLLIKRHIRETMGDFVENSSRVYGVSGGYFYVRLPRNRRRVVESVVDAEWRKLLTYGIHLRRYSIGLALRAMHGEQLT